MKKQSDLAVEGEGLTKLVFASSRWWFRGGSVRGPSVHRYITHGDIWLAMTDWDGEEKGNA